jgi:hypothetical protein
MKLQLEAKSSARYKWGGANRAWVGGVDGRRVTGGYVMRVAEHLPAFTDCI